MNLNKLLLNELKEKKAKLDDWSNYQIERANKAIEEAKRKYLEIFEYETKKIVDEKINLPKKHENYENAIKLWEKFIIDFENLKNINDKKELVEIILLKLKNNYDEASNNLILELEQIEKKLLIEEFKQNKDIKVMRKPYSWNESYLLKNNDDILVLEFEFKPNRNVKTTILSNSPKHKSTVLDLTYNGKKTRKMNNDILNQLLEQINNKILTIQFQGKKIIEVYEDFKDYKIINKFGTFLEINECDDYDKILEIDNKNKIIKINWK